MSQKHPKRRYYPRMKILRRDGFICGYCFENQATTVDHIVPVAYRDNPSEENLIACCTRCNSIAGSMVFDSLQAKRDYIQGVIASSPKWKRRRDPYVQVDIDDKRKPIMVAPEEKKDQRKHPKVNDRPRPATDVFSQSVVRESLKAIIEHYGFKHDDIRVSDLQEIANILSGMVEKKPAWGWIYLRNFLNLKLDASVKLTTAIMRLGALIDGAPKIQVTGEQVTVIAVGKVKPGAVILANSKQCENPTCKLDFVPSVPWQKFHSAECRKGGKK